MRCHPYFLGSTGGSAIDIWNVAFPSLAGDSPSLTQRIIYESVCVCVCVCVCV